MLSRKALAKLFTGCAILTFTLAFANVHTLLPENLPYAESQQRLADLFGWQPDANANNLCLGTYQLPKYISNHPVLDEKAAIEVTSSGEQIFKQNGVSELNKDVVITQPGRLIYADKIYLFRNKTTGKIYRIVLVGRVRIYEEKSVLITDHALITLNPRTIHITRSAYHYFTDATTLKTGTQPFNAWGTAVTGDQSADNVMVLHNASYSTCKPTAPTWRISAKKVVLDKPNNVGKVYNATLKVGVVPVFWFPYYSFQLNHQRKSGFLMPVFGHSDQTGRYLGFPYYFNLAPNYDLLFTPEYYGQRGFRALANFRYLSESSKGFITVSGLPNDKVFQNERNTYKNTYSNNPLYPTAEYQPYLNALNSMKNAREALSMQDYSTFSRHFYLRYYFNWVSDPYYFQDITSGTLPNSSTLTNQLLNLLQADYSTSNWDFNAYLLHYQTLHLITQIQHISQALDQYSRLPTFDVNTYYTLARVLDIEAYSDYSNFAYDSFFPITRPTGSRFHVRPGLSLSLKSAAAYLKPQVWLDNVAYDLNAPTPGIGKSASRTLPIVDIESGAHLLREFTFRDDHYTQTLEPKLFYLYVPYKNQNNLPNFDTLQLPFYFDQLFSLNAFEGIDRLENADQMSMSLTSNILRDETGAKIFSASIGSIYYFEQPRVCLIPGCTLSSRNVSPIAGQATFYPDNVWNVTAAAAYDPVLDVMNNASIGVGYHRDTLRVINLSYQYVTANAATLPTFTSTAPLALNSFANTSNHIIFNFAWPISMRWSTLAYTDYDATLRRVDNLYAGVQYDSCCYALRFVYKRLYSGSQLNPNGSLKNNYDPGYFIELTLKGLGSFGSGSNSLLSGLIPGYKPS